MDKLYLFVGKGIVWSFFLLVVTAAVCLLWVTIFRYIWYTFKRVLLPVPETWIQDWIDTIRISDDWHSHVKIFRKGKWFIWFSPETKNILNKVAFGRIK